MAKSTACGQKSGLPKTSSECGSAGRGCNSNRKSGTTNTQQNGPQTQHPPDAGTPDWFLPPQPLDSENGSPSSGQPDGEQADSATSSPQTTTHPLDSEPQLSRPEEEMQAMKASIAEKSKVYRIMRFEKATPEGKTAYRLCSGWLAGFNISLFALANSETIGTTAVLRLGFAANTDIC